MTESRKPFFIGVFLLGGVALLAAGLLLLSRDSLLAKPVEYVVYFTGALDGLDVGADVTYRGVKVGNVRQIELSYDRSINDVVMPVTIRISADSGRSAEGGFDRVVDRLIERGLRAQLQTPSLLTGKAIVALDFFPGQEGYIRDPHVIELPAIPTVPSRIDQAADVLRELVSGLKEIPMKETLEAANKTLLAFERLASAPETQAAIESLSVTLNNFEQISQQLNTRLPTMLDDVESGSSALKEALADVRHAAQNARDALQEMETMVSDSRRSIGPESELQYELLQSLQNLGQASKALQRTAESIEQQPQSIIFGKKR
ncbi:MlaD family protein [Denitrificimonas sp. JX-1]|uniref:MlaD family protein n=1 Tax=Denitrificimonas halotolerans TaxID=3098930 RepID=A0ABU5GSU6_9GAMM|nr:MlaD family protein [Denitrificimonas sp. JX-1]MDY7220061.1 MlaD family protein [Denitrificimonas sp. JX-1]